MGNRVILVFGEKNRGHRLSEESLKRIKRALQVYDRGDVIILMGGLFSEEQCGITVSEAMKSYMERCAKKVPRECVLVEGESLTTIQNISFACGKFSESLNDKKMRKVIVSSAYHVPRCWLACALIGGFYPKVCAAGNMLDGLSFKVVAREVVGVLATIAYSVGFGFIERHVQSKRRSVFSSAGP